MSTNSFANTLRTKSRTRAAPAHGARPSRIGCGFPPAAARAKASRPQQKVRGRRVVWTAHTIRMHAALIACAPATAGRRAGALPT